MANLRASQYRSFAQRPPTSPPSLTITSPADGAQVQAGVAFTLAAAASDPEDGDRRAFVQWESDRDGFLGGGSPLSAILTSGGAHLITAKVTDTSGTTVPYSIRLEATESYPPRRYIDRPRHNEMVSGNFLVKGWATDSSGVTSVTFQVDGVPVSLSSLIYGTHRADVCAAHSDLNDPNCPYVGFQGWLDTEQLTNGAHVLKLTATDYFDNVTTMNRRFQKVTTKLFEAVADAWVSEAEPTRNFGYDTSLQVRASGSSQAKHTYLKFQVSGLTGTVVSATLKLYTQSTPLQGCRVYWMQDTSWGEHTITWQTAPLAFYLQYPTTTYPANSPIEIDVSSIVSGNGTYTIGLVAPDVPGQAFYSRELLYSSFRPRLSVTTY